MVRSRLHSILGDKRMKLMELHRISGVSYGALHAMYHGKSTRIDYSTIDALCRFLGCLPGDLLEYVPDDKAGYPPPGGVPK